MIASFQFLFERVKGYFFYKFGFIHCKIFFFKFRNQQFMIISHIKSETERNKVTKI